MYICESLIVSKFGSISINTGEMMIRVSMKAHCAPGLQFGTKIIPQHYIEKVFLIFLLVSLDMMNDYFQIK